MLVLVCLWRCKTTRMLFVLPPADWHQWRQPGQADQRLAPTAAHWRGGEDSLCHGGQPTGRQDGCARKNYAFTLFTVWLPCLFGRVARKQLWPFLSSCYMQLKVFLFFNGCVYLLKWQLGPAPVCRNDPYHNERNIQACFLSSDLTPLNSLSAIWAFCTLLKALKDCEKRLLLSQSSVYDFRWKVENFSVGNSLLWCWF